MREHGVRFFPGNEKAQSRAGSYRVILVRLAGEPFDTVLMLNVSMLSYATAPFYMLIRELQHRIQRCTGSMEFHNNLVTFSNELEVSFKMGVKRSQFEFLYVPLCTSNA